MISDAKIELGGPVVDLEIEKMMPELLDKALRDVKPYITETRYVTIPYTRYAIDLTGCNINTVVQIFRTANPSRVADFTDIYSLSTINTANSSPTNLLLADYLYRTQMNQIKSTITTDLDFTFDKSENKIYINTFYPRPIKVTLAYIPDFKDVSDITDQYWINYVQRMFVALCKIALGRIRGKYELSSSLYKLDGSQILSEGLSEREQLLQELSDNSDLVFPMD